jgi:hypothetical protein
MMSSGDDAMKDLFSVAGKKAIVTGAAAAWMLLLTRRTT